jgi:hypothetical protein
MTETIPARSVTERGFTIYDAFRDQYGADVRLQESSLATERCIWVFSSKHGFPDEPASPHLNLAQAERVRDALDAFIRETKETLQAESLAAADLDDGAQV